MTPNLTNVLIGEDWKVCRVDFSRAFRLYKDLRNPGDLVRCDRPLDAYAPDIAEVTGLLALPAPAVAALARGAVRRLRATAWLAQGDTWGLAPTTVSRSMLVPRAGRYYERVARAAARLLRAHPVPLVQ